MVEISIDKIKGQFLDRRAIIRAMDSASAKAFIASAASIRTIAQRSMRYRKIGPNYKPSAPGSPPRARTGRGSSRDALIRKFLFFAWEPSSRTIVVGPVRLNRSTRAQEALEHGGYTAFDRRRVRKVGGGGEIRIVEDGRGGTEVRGVPGVRVVYAKLRTRAQARRATELNARIYGEPKRVSVEKRPYMAPAMKREVPKLAPRWSNSIKGAS